MTGGNESKQKIVGQVTDLLKKYPVVGVVDVVSLPARQFSNMRATLRGKAVVYLAKKRLTKIAFKEANLPGVEGLNTFLEKAIIPGLIFTTENPFSLFKTLKKAQSKAPIKGGQIAPDDIIVPAGPTEFSPGPIIGELGQFGIKSGVENGKVAVKADKVVAKAGDEVSPVLAKLLTRLGIEPMKIGLNVQAVLEKGDILTKDVLDVDEEWYFAQLTKAAADALTLSVELAIPNTASMPLLLSKAAREAYTLSLERDIATADTVRALLAKAHNQAATLQEKV
ncbi:MAG: 50S ribosomal protein L10 [Candidatus Woesearchaeota archaeon]|nr:MAG: 50S ribosomal protein L10 [Candidatus Woesearchaeota archaeon]